MITEAQYASWYLRQAQAHDTYSLARTYNLMGTVPAFILAYSGATNQMLTIEKGWIVKYAFPIFCVLYIGFAQFNAIVDSIYSHSYFKIAFSYYKNQGIIVVDNKPLLLFSSTFQRAHLFPFLLMLMWSIIMVNSKLGTAGQIMSPLIFAYLIEMVCSTVFGILTSPQICK